MNAHPGFPSGTATNVACSGKSTAMRLSPKLNDELPGTGCDEVLDTRQMPAAVASRIGTCSATCDRNRTPINTTPKMTFVTDLDTPVGWRGVPTVSPGPASSPSDSPTAQRAGTPGAAAGAPGSSGGASSTAPS